MARRKIRMLTKSKAPMYGVDKNYILQRTKVMDHGLEVSDVGNVLMRNAKALEQTLLTVATQEILKSTLPEVTSKADARKLLDRWFPLLDKLFFFSLIGKARRDVIQLYEDPEPIDGVFWDRPVYGFYDWDDNKIYIRVDGQTKSPNTPDTNAEALLTALLHEMVHFALAHFSCKESCCEVNFVDPRHGVGLHGQGTVWCDVMTCCYEALQRLVGWEVDYHHDIAAGIIEEMKQLEDSNESYKWEPTQAQLLEWHVQDDEEVQHAIAHAVHRCSGCFCCACHICENSDSRFEVSGLPEDECVYEACLCKCHCWWRFQWFGRLGRDLQLFLGLGLLAFTHETCLSLWLIHLELIFHLLLAVDNL